MWFEYVRTAKDSGNESCCLHALSAYASSEETRKGKESWNRMSSLGYKDTKIEILFSPFLTVHPFFFFWPWVCTMLKCKRLYITIDDSYLERHSFL